MRPLSPMKKLSAKIRAKKKRQRAKAEAKDKVSPEELQIFRTRHAAKRLRERYGIFLRATKLNEIVLEQIDSGIAIKVAKRKPFYLVDIKGQLVLVVVRDRTVTTVVRKSPDNCPDWALE